MLLNERRVTNARHRKGLTQRQMAQQSGLSLTVIHKAENGGSVLPPIAQRICLFLGLDLEKVYKPMPRSKRGRKRAAA
jgi:DNA-binding XRE family transcriptional regulator